MYEYERLLLRQSHNISRILVKCWDIIGKHTFTVIGLLFTQSQPQIDQHTYTPTHRWQWLNPLRRSQVSDTETESVKCKWYGLFKGNGH